MSGGHCQQPQGESRPGVIKFSPPGAYALSVPSLSKSYILYSIKCEMESIDCTSPGKCQILTFTRTIMRIEAEKFKSRPVITGSRFRLPLETQPRWLIRSDPTTECDGLFYSIPLWCQAYNTAITVHGVCFCVCTWIQVSSLCISVSDSLEHINADFTGANANVSFYPKWGRT